jgi:hypothetical protein
VQLENIMAPKLSARQQAQLAWLEQLPPKFARLDRVIEQLSVNQADESTLRGAQRLLDELKAQASTLGVSALGDTFGYMGTLLRRSGGHQVKVRGLREMLMGAKINHEGALRKASSPEGDPEATSP